MKSGKGNARLHANVQQLWRIIVPSLVFLAGQTILKNLLADWQPCNGEAASLVLMPILIGRYFAHCHQSRSNQTITVLTALSAAGFLWLCVDAQAKLIQVAGSCVAGPVNEEIIYRGFVYSEGKRCYGVEHSLLLSALLFAAGHGTTSAFLPGFFVGILLALAFERSNSLRYPVVMHILWNVIIQGVSAPV